MTQFPDLVLRNGHVWLPAGPVHADVVVTSGRIVDITAAGAAPDADLVVDARGLTVLPGVIDSQVHFREPGNEHKEDLATGTASAALGGVVAVFEMPNTKPSTTTAEALADKLDRAAGRAWTDHAFFVGASAENADDLGRLERLPGCCGVKIFMGASTGDLLVPDDENLARALASGRRRVAIHAEDEPRMQERRHLVEGGAPVSAHPQWRDAESAIRATRRILRLARLAARPVHVLHITTEEEMDLLAQHKDIATLECTPQHLTFTAEEYERLGTRLQMNPPIREPRHREGLWRALQRGVVDVIGSDHAPHTLEEKARPYPDSPAGMPGVQTLLPVMLTHVAAGRLSMQRLVDLVCAGPQRLFQIARKGRIAVGYDADFTVIDPAARHTLRDADMASRCGWTPFDGMECTGKAIMTIVRGTVVMRDGALQGDPIGRPVQFVDTLEPDPDASRH